MAPISKRNQQRRDASAKAAIANTISAEAREAHAKLPPLVQQGPKHLKVEAARPEKPRTAKLVAAQSWARCVEMFERLPLVASAGDHETPENDYGGLVSTLNFQADESNGEGKTGVMFRGVPSCQKKGKTREYIAANSKPHMAVLYALLLSCADIPFSGFFSRFAAIRGANTSWHTDANTRVCEGLAS